MLLLKKHWTYPLLFLIAFAVPLAAIAQQPRAGCRLATEQDKAEMAARGLPPSFQVCPAEEQILGIGRDFDQWYAQLKTQSPCNRNTCTLSCRTRNTGAQVCGPTATRWNALGCHPNNRTAIFPTVSHGFAAHIELLRRYCGERGRCTIGRVIEQWTAVAGDRPAYAAFVSRHSGMPINQVFDPNDIDLMGRIALSMACFEAGSLPYNAAELKQGLIMAGGGARVPTPANTGQLLNDSLLGSYAANPGTSPNSFPGSWAYPSTSLSGNQYTPPPPPSSPLPLLSNTPTAGQAATSPAGSNTTQSSGQSAASVPGPAVATLITQSSNVTRGRNIIVSWSSLGMRPDAQCKLSLEMPGAAETAVTEGNGGSRPVLIPLSASPGTATFRLRCTPFTGSPVEKTATFSVE